MVQPSSRCGSEQEETMIKREAEMTTRVLRGSGTVAVSTTREQGRRKREQPGSLRSERTLDLVDPRKGSATTETTRGNRRRTERQALERKTPKVGAREEAVAKKASAERCLKQRERLPKKERQ